MFFKFRKPIAAKPGEINHEAFDKFTFVHFAIGVAYSFLGLSFGLVVFLAVVWEVVENPIKAHMSFLFPHGTSDSWANLTVDALAVIAGWIVAQSIFLNVLPH